MLHGASSGRVQPLLSRVKCIFDDLHVADPVHQSQIKTHICQLTHWCTSQKFGPSDDQPIHLTTLQLRGGPRKTKRDYDDKPRDSKPAYNRDDRPRKPRDTSTPPPSAQDNVAAIQPRGDGDEARREKPRHKKSNFAKPERRDHGDAVVTTKKPYKAEGYKGKSDGPKPAYKGKSDGPKPAYKGKSDGPKPAYKGKSEGHKGKSDGSKSAYKGKSDGASSKPKAKATDTSKRFVPPGGKPKPRKPRA